MTAQDIFTTILRVTYTRSDFSRRIDLLRSYFDGLLYQEEKINLAEFLQNREVSEYDRNILAAIIDDLASIMDRNTAPQTIAELKNKLDVLPELTVYLPYSLSSEEITKFGIWCRQNIKSDVLIDVRIDKSVVGGCSFVWKGIHHDYSLHYLLEKNRDKVLELVSAKIK